MMFNVVLSDINFKYAHPNMENMRWKVLIHIWFFFGLFLDGFFNVESEIFDHSVNFKQKKS